MGLFGLPLAALLVIAGLVVIVAAFLFKWILLIAAVALILLGIYVAATGHFP
jgi:hypothetical protein